MRLIGRVILVVIALAGTARAAQPSIWLLHLNGIGGERRIDHTLVDGLVQGGLDAQTNIYDWTGPDTGLAALTVTKRHQEESAKVAEMIEKEFRADPDRPIVLTGHSAGAGIAAYALEKLPDDVVIETLLMLQPALSPGYDLSKALRHVHGKAYAFTSLGDVIVLSAGTKMFGTVDGIKTDAAGRVGFEIPETADKFEYAKLMQIPYRPEWVRFGNTGEHIGPMRRAFAREVIAPLLLTGKLPPTPATAPTTQPADARPQ
ncbi:MAG: hypothetical protein ACREJC_02055 [Tepidisphaeraceae bacterium]